MRAIPKYFILCLLLVPLWAGAQACHERDKVRISGKAVVFFSLSQGEYDSLSAEDQEAYTELLSDFYTYSGQIGKYLDQQRIAHILTGSRYIEVENSGKTIYCYDKKAFEDEVGMILTNGRKRPKVISGVVVETEALPIIRKYFSLK
jgi:hypothetical protein